MTHYEMFQGIEHTFNNILSGIRECFREHAFGLIRVHELVSKGMPVIGEFLGMAFDVEDESDRIELPCHNKSILIPVLIIIDEQVQVLCTISVMLPQVHLDFDGIPAQVNSPQGGIMWLRYAQNTVYHTHFPSNMVLLFSVGKVLV
jgi:hypothetical protein